MPRCASAENKRTRRHIHVECIVDMMDGTDDLVCLNCFDVWQQLKREAGQRLAATLDQEAADRSLTMKRYSERLVDGKWVRE